MKALIALALLVSGSSAVAFDTITCKGNVDYGTPSDLVMTLTAGGNADIDSVPEGTDVSYRLVVTKAGKEWTDLTVKAQKHDVLFSFEGNSRNGGHIEGSIYLDELGESSIYIYKQTFAMDCGG